MKKKVYFVQPSNILSGAVFLPYSVGAIAAYSWQFESIGSKFELQPFIFTKKAVAEVMGEMDNPCVVGFSNYMWNVEYNLLLASKIKASWPECIIVFGGPQIPENTEFLEEYSYIDVLIYGEGEEAFYKILTAISSGESFEKIDNIAYSSGRELRKTKKSPPGDISNYPSPYTSGLFDDIIHNEKYKGTQFDTIIETNRGCPYKCIYCAWSGVDSAIRQFPIEKIKSELEWLAKNKIAYCICGDANFGILERDEGIVDYLVELKKQYGYPQKFETTAAKNKDELTFRINSKLDSVGLNKGVSVACQSLSPQVLKNIGRRNMNIDYFASQLKRYRDAGMHTYTDLILGLPGETFESFCRGLFAVIEAGQYFSININRCELLPNSLMYSAEIVSKYKIKTIRSFFCQNHSKCSDDSSLGSRSELVVETDTMSRSDWRRACRISACVQSFHCMGLLRFFAVFLRRAKNISYFNFYMSVYEWIEKSGTVTKEILDYVMASLDAFLAGNGDIAFADERFGDIYYPYEEALFLCYAVQLDEFYDNISECLKQYFDDEKFFDELLLFQKHMITRPDCENELIRFDYDWLGYFDDIYDIKLKIPEQKQTHVRFENKNGIKTWQDYARKIVWQGKRDNLTVNNKVFFK